jgi:hypothetical protein
MLLMAAAQSELCFSAGALRCTGWLMLITLATPPCVMCTTLPALLYIALQVFAIKLGLHHRTAEHRWQRHTC